MPTLTCLLIIIECKISFDWLGLGERDSVEGPLMSDSVKMDLQFDVVSDDSASHLLVMMI